MEERMRRRKEKNQGLMMGSILETHHSKGWEGKMSVMGVSTHPVEGEKEREYIQEGNVESRAWQSSRTDICANTVNILSQ